MKKLSRTSVKIPPPIVTLIFAAFMFLINRYFPLEITFSEKHFFIIPALVIAFLLLFPALSQFRRNKTTVNPLKPEAANTLVIAGVYRYSRNPMYLGMALVLFSWGGYLANPLNLFIFIGYIFYMNYFQIEVEERALEKLFGEAFLDYKRRVRRWL